MDHTCKLCSQKFFISPDELSFLEKVSPTIQGQKYLLPPSQLCPRCRTMRRLAFRNERRLYHRKCDLSGKEIISIYSHDKPYKVYDQKEWWSDKWDAMDYGRDFNFTRPFFDQFNELMHDVPQLSMMTANNENSEYTNCVSHLKNCYLVFSADYSQDCYYSVWVENSKDCVDNLQIDQSELLYYCFFCHSCYNSTFLINCSQCSDSNFLYDCKGSSHCFMSTGLRNQQYYIFNQSHSKEAYEEKMKAYDFGSSKMIEQCKKQFQSLIQKYPHLYMYRTGRVQNSTGNLLTDTDNCNYCFDTLRGKDCMYIQGAFDIKDMQHSSYVMGEMGYENCECVPAPQDSGFNVNTYTGSNLWYCHTCMNNCQNCFGCVGLRHKQYCILNTQYTKEQYEELLPKIIQHMRTPALHAGHPAEWGEFFPFSLSPFAYNETTAFDYFPLTKEKALAYGASWKEDTESSHHYGQEPELPDHIINTSDTIIQNILTCSTCTKKYRIIQQELLFYKGRNIAIPRKCFDCRHRDRLTWKGGWTLWERECSACKKKLQSTYSPEHNETLFCEECYLVLMRNQI